MTKLNIVQFIESHPSDWKDLLAAKPYCLKIKQSEFGNGEYYMFNYDMIESDNYDPIVAEARGLVLYVGDGGRIHVIRKGFNRFFNVGEGPAAPIDWNTAEATIKEDGTLVFASNYAGVWRFGTRQNFDLWSAPMNSELYPTFWDLWRETVKQYPGLHDGNMISGLTYCFELCTRHNRVVIDYPEPKIFLLAVFVNETGDEFSYMDVQREASFFGCPVPEKYRLSSEEDYAKLVETFGVQHEGLVVRDALGRRVKMKSKLYFDLHKSVSNGAMDLEAIVGLCRKGEEAEFLSYFPEYGDKFASVKNQIQKAYGRIGDIRKKTGIEKQINESRKEFAMLHKNAADSVLWFKAWDEKLTDDFVMTLPDEKFISLFGIK